MDSTPPTPVPPSIASALPWLQEIARIGVVAIGTLYVVGLLIVNIELARYGIVNLTLARPEYIIAGASWIFLTLGTMVGMQASLPQMEKHWRSKGWRGWLWLPYDVLVTFVAAPVILLGFLGTADSIAAGLPWSILAGIIVLDWNAWGVTLISNRFRRALGSGLVTTRVTSGAVRWSDFSIIIPFLLLGLTWYAISLFPTIPRHFGGGRKPIVRVVLPEAPQPDWAAFGLPRGEDRKTIGPVVLLLETDAMLFVKRRESCSPWPWPSAKGKAQAVGIDKKLVAGLVYIAETKEVSQDSPTLITPPPAPPPPRKTP